jgi:putative endopeptidase
VGVRTPIGSGIAIDQKNPDRYVLIVTHAGLGLPNRTYYLGDTAKPEQLAQYQAHIARLLTLAEVPDAAAKAEKIVAFETAIANLHWLPAQRRDRDKTYNPMTRAELKALAPTYEWDTSFDALGLPAVERVVVRELDAIKPLGELWAATPLDTLKAYATYHAIRGDASVLPKAFDDEVFDFFGRTLNGQPEQRAREKRGVDAVGGALGEAVGQLYVARHFPPESKAKMVALVENLRAAYGKRIRALTWMSEETKTVALEKLAAFRPKIGYPDKWRDYSALEIKPGDAYGNAARAAVFDHARDVARFYGPTDRDEWGMTPQTVNAYYSSVFNEIAFPAAILQPPFFDPNADPAVNYGAIGGVIGHEMGHGFDDQGSKSDAKGVLRTWWNEGDVTRFKALVDKLDAQYSAFEALPGLKVDGRFTLGENIGDNGGLQVAYEAYRLSLGGQEADVRDGFTGDQRFFLGWAQVWRTLIRDEALTNQVKSDPHSPGYFRTIGPVRNMDAWYAAFDVQPGERYYLPPEERVHIW